MLNHFSRVQLFATLWTLGAHQAPLSMGFSRQEHWGGLPCPPPGDLPHPGIESASLMSPALVVGSLPLALPGKPLFLWRWRQSTSPLPPNSLQRMGALLADAGSRGNGGECGIYEGPGQMPQAWFAWDAWHCALGHGSSCHLLFWSKHAGSQTNLNRLNCILTLPLFMSICYKLHLTLEVHVEWAVTFAS